MNLFHSRPGRPAALGVALAATLLTAGCGGGSDIATNDTAKDDDQALRFASCMRKHGVDTPDPGTSRSVASSSPKNLKATQTALAACGDLAPKVQSSSRGSRAEITDKQLLLAKCLRSNGVKATDPQTDATGDTSFTVQDGLGAVGKNAFRACASEFKAAGVPAPTE